MSKWALARGHAKLNAFKENFYFINEWLPCGFCDFCRTESLATDNWTFSIDFIASKPSDMLRSLYLAIGQLETNELNLEYFDCWRVRTASQFQVHNWRQISHQLRKIGSKNSRVVRVCVGEMQSIAPKGRRYGNYVNANDKPKRFLISISCQCEDLGRYRNRKVAKDANYH